MEAMAEDTRGKGSRLKRALRMLAMLLAAAVFCGVLYLCGTALHSFDAGTAEESAESYAVERDSPAAERSVAGETGDIGQLRKMAGFPLLYMEGQPFLGEAANASWDGGTARLITMTYSSGIVITAVSPASAAGLIKRGGLALQADAYRTLLLQGSRRQAVLAEGEKASCLYFMTDDAAYAVYAQGLTGEQLSQVLDARGLSVR